MDTNQPHSSLTLPGAIIIAAALIAVAIIWVKKPASAPAVVTDEPALKEVTMAPVTSADHILGNPEAPIIIVEYSDPSCPYCKTFHPTMRKIIDEYGPSGKVAWVYRSFPLDKPDAQGRILHPNANFESQAQECAAALGGNDAFWKFTHRLYEVTQSDKGITLDRSEIPKIAEYIGLDAVGFNSCLSSERFKDKVERSYLDGVNAGVSGTPYSIIITPSGSKIPMIGAQSYATFKTAIDALLGEVK
jgi:protein-disulfide isomerase